MRPNLPMLLSTTALVAALVAPSAMQAENRSENQSHAGQQQQTEQQQQRPETHRTIRSDTATLFGLRERFSSSSGIRMARQ